MATSKPGTKVNVICEVHGFVIQTAPSPGAGRKDPLRKPRVEIITTNRAVFRAALQRMQAAVDDPNTTWACSDNDDKALAVRRQKADATPRLLSSNETSPESDAIATVENRSADDF
jgi:hypothetical protein